MDTNNNDITTTIEDSMPPITKEGAKELYQREMTKLDRRFLTGFYLTGIGLGFAFQWSPNQPQYLTDIGVVAAGAGVLTMFFAGAQAFDSANTYVNNVAEYVKEKFHLTLKD